VVAGWIFGWSVGWIFGWSVGWIFGWSVGWSVGWWFGWSEPSARTPYCACNPLQRLSFLPIPELRRLRYDSRRRLVT
jgi:hypothetical protein